MKSLLIITMSLFCLLVQAQVVTGLRPDPSAKFGEWSEWKTSEVTFDDGTVLNVEYRIVLASRKGIACNYSVEVKNNSDLKLDVKIVYNYFDRLVKKNFSETFKGSAKPGKVVSADLAVQGCKKEKGSTEEDGAKICHSCEFGVDIHVYK